MKHLLLVFTVVCVTGFTMAQTKVASVNSQGLLDSLPSYLEAQKTLEEIRISGLTELQEMEANLNKAIQNFREKEKDMAPVVRDLEEKKLMQKDQEIQTKQQSLQQDLQRIAQELNQPILEMVQKAVDNVAKANKYDYVVDQSMLLYFNEMHDITDKVGAELEKIDSPR